MSITILSPGQIPSKFSAAAFVSILSLFLPFVLFQFPGEKGERQGDFFRARRQMVESLRAQGIKDPRVLEAMSLAPRHLFVPDAHRRSAYQDHPLPIGEGQTISQPYIVALMTELLQLKKGDRVLEIGTGSGYQAAVLSHMAREVYTIEILPSLAERARKVLAELGYRNVWVKIGDGYFGWEEKAPFDAIVVTAAIGKIPEPLWNQLREGGRLVMPLGTERQTQKLIRARKIDGRQQLEEITAVLFVPMTGEAQKGSR